MTATPGAAGTFSNRSRLQLLLLAAALLFLTEALSHVVAAGRGPVSDFDVFHMAGRLVWRGDLLAAYDYDDFRRLQKLMRGRSDNLAYAYPPPYALVVAPLGLLPIGAAWLLFMGGTLALWLWALAGLAREETTTALMIALAPLYISLVAGQNGFLTGSLLALACLALRDGRAVAGVPLGLMVIKPQLALGLGLYVLASRNWRVLGVAALTALTLCGAATWLLGTEAWPAFLSSTREQADIMARGLYRFYRMQSPFAIAMSLHLPLRAAFVAQAAGFLGAAGLVVAAALRCPPATAMGIAVLAATHFSPYGYDYDLPLLVVGMALLLVPSIGVVPLWRRRVALLCLPASALWSLSRLMWMNPHLKHQEWPPAFGAMATLACLWLIAPPLVARGKA